LKLWDIFEKKKKDEDNTESVEQDREYSEEEFLKRLAAFEKAYLAVVIIAAAIAAAGIAVAVIIRVSYGLILAIAAVLFYLGAVSNILYSKLGLAYTSASGELYVTEYYGRGKEDAWIPRRLMWIDVRSIGDEAFDHESSREIRTLHLPRTVVHIGKNVFLGCENISRICFEGSPEDWEAIEKESDMDGIEIEFFCDVAYPEEKSKKEKRVKKSKKDKKAQEDK
jgi:hypothetical protein